MINTDEQPLRSILVLEDVDETRHLIGRMLRGNGYHVTLASDEEDAILMATSRCPDLILLMSLGLQSEQLIAAAQRIRKQADLSSDVAIVAFCASNIPEGAEIEVKTNMYLTRPDNFNQLRAFLRRLLCRELPNA